ncbi:MAG: YbaK/EbsC family protein [Candidatus Abyssubacteria bacterium]
MPARKLKEYLDSNNVKYEVLTHKLAYTAQEVAATQGVTGWKVAKTVVCNCDGKYMLVVVQAPKLVDLERLKQALECNEAHLATEAEMAKLFPGVDVGAEPPFGNLYNLPVYIDREMTEMPDIVFRAGSHTETIRISYKDFERLVKPTIIDVCKPVEA